MSLFEDETLRYLKQTCIYLPVFQLFDSFETLIDVVGASGIIKSESVTELR